MVTKFDIFLTKKRGKKIVFLVQIDYFANVFGKTCQILDLTKLEKQNPIQNCYYYYYYFHFKFNFLYGNVLTHEWA